MQEFSTFPVRYHSGFPIPYPSGLPTLKEGRYEALERAIAGDAPKQFVRVYEQGKSRRGNKRTWSEFIAKGGQKAYPNESITEHFITRLGQALNLNIADSSLYWGKGQIRFLSRYFLKPHLLLIHGAEVFEGYFSDKKFVKEVEEKKQARRVFTFQVVEASLAKLYPSYAEELIDSFVKLLAFDAIVGNNDRHYVNWGVIAPLSGKGPVELAPIYDTARALFWNKMEDALEEMDTRGNLAFEIEGYVNRSKPKTGWQDCHDLNHFELIEKIAKGNTRHKLILQGIIPPAFVRSAENLLQTEFSRLFSERRSRILLQCLQRRIEKYAGAIV